MGWVTSVVERARRSAAVLVDILLPCCVWLGEVFVAITVAGTANSAVMRD